MKYSSWGNYPHVTPHAIWPICWRDQCIDFQRYEKNFLAYGQGRSYGDSCLTTGIALATQQLNRFIHFDREQGILRCEAGITFHTMLNIIVPHGWFLPVVPGTQYISLGGAIANDIHGKNHHRAGSFGHHVISFELLRSNGKKYICSAQQNPDLYFATIGGLGLTGLILWAEIKLMRIESAYLLVETIRFNNLDEFFEINLASEPDFNYTVAWFDASAKQGRGIYLRANHLTDRSFATYSKRALTVPFTLPSFILNPLSIKAFNTFYFNKHIAKLMRSIQHYHAFFFQLDNLRNWNNLYGRRGFLQYQCIVPQTDPQIIQEILKVITKSQLSSFLSVLKTFAVKPAAGLMSFPQAGITLALDFPFCGQKLLSGLNTLDQLVIAAKGRVYTAKDARMSAKTFQHYYPQWREFLSYKDPHFNSHFWQRVTTE